MGLSAFNRFAIIRLIGLAVVGILHTACYLNSSIVGDNLAASSLTSSPKAELTGVPSSVVSNALMLATVGTSAIVEYKFKFGLASLTNCQDSSGFSASFPTNSPLSATIITGNGVYKVCVVGKDALGNWQSYSDVTEATWTYTAICDSLIADNFGGGDGTSGNPFRICSINQWKYFAATSSSWALSIKLESDLDFTGITYADAVSVGVGATAFTGIFDGDSHFIKNVTINSTTNSFALFSNTDGNVTIKQLNLKDFNLTASSGNLSSLILSHGSTGKLTISNLSIENVIYGKPASGVIRTSTGQVDIRNVTVTNVTSTAGTEIGGIIGKLTANGVFMNVTVSQLNHTVTVTSNNSLGGLIGKSAGTATGISLSFENIKILNSSIGYATASSFAGGIIGKAWDSTLSFTDVNVSSTINGSNGAGLASDVQNISGSNVGLIVNRSSFNGTITFSAGTTGGLFGLVCANTMNINKSFTKGTLSAFGGIAGGLAGQIGCGSHTIFNSYSQMAITNAGGGGSSGGMIGTLGDFFVNFQATYFSGSITTSSPAGCIMGKNFASPSFFDTYYDSTRCSKSAVDSAAFTGVTSLTTAALQTATPFTNFSTLNWLFTAGQDPKLTWEP